MSKDQSFQASAKQVKFLQTKSAAMIASPSSARDSEFSLALIKLREYLPPRPYCDRLVTIYCNHFERSMRVLHIPTFMREYEQIWNGLEACSPSIVPQLTAVMTMAYHMDNTNRPSDDHSHRSYLKGSAVDLVQGWIDELSRKQRTELPSLQVEILLLLSRSLRGMQPEKLWSSTGALVRSAMIMGLHLDPSAVKGFSPFQAEMRRRLWATIVEIDLQASMTTALPLVLPEIAAPVIPLNLNDWEFDEGSTTLPPSHPLETHTENLYQVVLASSLPLRLKALSLVQHSAPDLEEALHLGRKIEECLNNKPLAMKLYNHGSGPSDGGSLLHRVLVDLYLRRPVLCLYKPLLLGQNKHLPSHSEISKHCLDSSLEILYYQELYTIPSLRPIADSPIAYQDFFYRCCKSDILWAALTCCQRIKVVQNDPADVPPDQRTGRKMNLVATVESTIEFLVERIGRKDSDLKDIVFLALAFQSVQLPDTTPDKSRALQQAVEQTLAVCREKLLQPMLATEHIHPPKRLRTAEPTPATTISPPVSNSRLTPISDTTSFPRDLWENSQQLLGEFPNLANEYIDFQAHLANPDDILNFGINQDWGWEHLWQ
jgi:hypothetical protein